MVRKKIEFLDKSSKTLDIFPVFFRTEVKPNVLPKNNLYRVYFFLFFVWSFRLFGWWLVPLPQYSSSKFPSFFLPPPPPQLTADVGLELRKASAGEAYLKPKKKAKKKLRPKVDGIWVLKAKMQPPPPYYKDTSLVSFELTVWYYKDTSLVSFELTVWYGLLFHY